MRQGERTDTEPSANLRKVISQPEAAGLLNVSPRSIQSVKAIEKEAPEGKELLVLAILTEMSILKAKPGSTDILTRFLTTRLWR